MLLIITSLSLLAPYILFKKHQIKTPLRVGFHIIKALTVTSVFHHLRLPHKCLRDIAFIADQIVIYVLVAYKSWFTFCDRKYGSYRVKICNIGMGIVGCVFYHCGKSTRTLCFSRNTSHAERWHALLHTFTIFNVYHLFDTITRQSQKCIE